MEKMKLMEYLIYGGVFILGLMSLWGILTAGNFAISVPWISSLLIALGGVAWGTTKFFKFDLVKAVAIF